METHTHCELKRQKNIKYFRSKSENIKISSFDSTITTKRDTKYKMELYTLMLTAYGCRQFTCIETNIKDYHTLGKTRL